jgi:NAD(P)-dependent dehydrogenase (short-subunit alcohol dehydrogenase family)
MMEPRLSRRVALVTGATGGIGDAVVRRLAAEDATVVVTDLDADRCEKLAGELTDAGGRAIGLGLDVTDEAAWQTVVARVTDELGSLAVLVNNAGIASMGTVETETRESWDRVIGVTQAGVWLGMKHGGPAIENSGGGSIVNIASIFGTVGGFGSQFSYHAAKGAVRLMTKNAALHWGTRGVRVNSLHPGFIETPLSRELWHGTPRLTAMIEGTPLGRLGRTEEVAAAVAFLASDDAGFMTGSELYVDGGWTAR